MRLPASDMDIAGLPSDILVEVTANIATTSLTPQSDIVNLRRSCKVFRDATAARKVGRCMAVHREWRMHWWDKARFLSVLRRCAASGNPEASYILGLEEFCNRRRKASGLRHLRRAMEHGHAAAAYMIGMITVHDSRSPCGIEQVLERLEGFSASASTGPRTRRRMASVRREAVSVMRRLTMRRWRMPEPPTPCANPWCGEMEAEAETAEAWDGDDEERRFCSRACRWKHEYYLKSLSAGDVHLYCKNCSARLTKQPLRNIMEMPSLNWEDVADNWFGGCCTSFGGASEKLVSQYINAYGRLEGTSLLDATSISIKTDYLEKDSVTQVACSVLSSDFVALEEAVTDVSVGKDHAPGKIKLNNSEEQEKTASIHAQPPVVLEEGPYASNSETNGVTPWTDQSGTIPLKNDVYVNSDESKNGCCVENMEKSNEETDLLLVDPCHCCCDSEYSGKAEDNPSLLSLGNQDKQTVLETKRDYKLTKNISLGSSFIIKACNLLNGFEWVELLCARCSSPLGSYPSQCSRAPADGRVRLFKCYTSTELPVAGPHDVFRGHTLERLFVNLLLEIAEDEISFRTVVRDLKTKRPILQIVLLSSKAWLFSGCCYENDMDGSHGTADLKPSVKLLYSDCSSASESDIRIVEEWSSKYRAEELYMMKRQIDELIECLNSALDNFPLSCSSLEGMCLSSLER